VKSIFAIIAIAVAVAAPIQARAQSATPVPRRVTKAQAKQGKQTQKHPIFWHPSAAQRGLTPSDLVAVTTPAGEKRYMRRKSLKPAK
jgi:hypothetical protein